MTEIRELIEEDIYNKVKYVASYDSFAWKDYSLKELKQKYKELKEKDVEIGDEIVVFFPFEGDYRSMIVIKLHNELWLNAIDKKGNTYSIERTNEYHKTGVHFDIPYLEG